MSPKTERTLRVVFSTLIVLQLAWVGRLAHARLKPVPSAPPQPPALVLGQSLDSVAIETAAGVSAVPLGKSGEWTVLFAYSSTCAFCDSVASDWSKFMQDDHGARILAVSREVVEQAEGYAKRWSWQAPAGRLVQTYPEDRALWITRRTPMLYVFDSTGTLVWNEHGESVGLIDSVVGRATRGR